MDKMTLEEIKKEYSSLKNKLSEFIDDGKESVFDSNTNPINDQSVFIEDKHNDKILGDQNIDIK